MVKVAQVSGRPQVTVDIILDDQEKAVAVNLSFERGGQHEPSACLWMMVS